MSNASSAPFIMQTPPPMGLSATTFSSLAENVEQGASIPELLLAATHCSRFINTTPSNVKGSALASFFSTISSLFRKQPQLPNDPKKARELVASKIRNLSSYVGDEIPDGSIQIKQFNFAMIPLIIEIIQLIMAMIEKFRAV